jgi:hypothetical protein
MATPGELARRAADLTDPAAGLGAVSTLRRQLDQLETLHIENAARAGWSWRRIATALGISKQAAHQKHAARLRPRLQRPALRPPEPGTATLRVADDVRLAVRAGRREANALGHDALHAEHLFVGALHADASLAALLADRGASRALVRREIRRLLPRSPEGIESRLPSAPSARIAVEQALREAVRRRSRELRLEHLVAVLLADTRSGVAQALANLGVSVIELEQVIAGRSVRPRA